MPNDSISFKYENKTCPMKNCFDIVKHLQCKYYIKNAEFHILKMPTNLMNCSCIYYILVQWVHKSSQKGVYVFCSEPKYGVSC